MTLILQIALISDQYFNDVWAGMLSDFAQPVLNILERLTISDVVNKNTAMSALIVSSSDSLESMLERHTSLDLQYPISAV